MKAWIERINGYKTSKHLISFAVIALLPFYLSAVGQTIKSHSSKKQEVSSPGNLTLKPVANNNPLKLNYPAEGNRVYRQAGKKLLWIAPDTVKTHAAEAMMLLDCVLQYGLNRDDYHPADLLYDKLNLYTTGFSKTNFAEKARFDRLLTDAMLTFMNDLHYGKLNPEHRPAQIDQGIAGFSAASELFKALKSDNFDRVITGVQPKSEAYTNLQYRMHMLEGRETAECVSFPESEIRKMAINMERLRWVDMNEQTFIQVNIPSFTLKFVTPDSIYNFKVIVGAPSSPTLVCQDVISNFSTKTNGYTSRLLFEIDRHPAMSIRGITDLELLSKTDRAVTTGYIAVNQAEKLAALLLKYDRRNNKTATVHKALVNGKAQRFSLRKPVPVIVTYLTLEINEGIISSYEDIYNQDTKLEMALYNTQLQLTLKK